MIPFFKLIVPDGRKLAAKKNRIQLLTIPYSHYCDLGAWALKVAGHDFDEHPYPPGLHVPPTLVARLGGEVKALSTSSAPGTTPTTLPVAILPDGTVLVDSWSILAYVEPKLDAVNDALRELLDGQVGTLSRQLVYWYLLKSSNHNVWSSLYLSDAGWSLRLVWMLTGRAISARFRKMFHVADEADVIAAREALSAAIQTLEQTYLDGLETPFIAGDQPGAADLALAAMMAPVVNPPEYWEGRWSEQLTLLMQQDAAYKDEVESWRQRIAGQHCMKVYSACR